jgi:hypothetical protein
MVRQAGYMKVVGRRCEGVGGRRQGRNPTSNSYRHLGSRQYIITGHTQQGTHGQKIQGRFTRCYIQEGL